MQSGSLGSFELLREGRVTRVQQTASDQEGGIFASRTGCEEEGVSLTTVYAPKPRLVETTIGDTFITSNIVLREQPEGNQDAAVLHMSGGTLEFNEDTFCPENIEESAEPAVTLVQGRTTVNGVVLDYDNATGTGTMAGPVNLERSAEGDSPALTANSDALEYQQDGDALILKDNVKIESDGRISEADVLEYDEDNSIAVLRGNPASSRKGEEVLQGDVITYYLDKNEATVVGNIEVELEIDLGEGDAPSSTSSQEEDLLLDPEEDFLPEPDEDFPPEPEEDF